MFAYRTRSTSALSVMATCLFAVAGCSSKPSEPVPVENVGEQHENWAIVGSNSHGAQGFQELWFLKGEVRALLLAAETLPDLPLWLSEDSHDGDRSEINGDQKGTKEHSYYHFDNCRFTEATTLLNQHYKDIVLALDDSAGPYSMFSERWAVTLKQFGFILHASQDFYAHSNWVESGETDIVDAGNLDWTILQPNAAVGQRMQVMEVVEGAPQDNSNATLVPELHQLKLTGTPRPFGLITGLYKNKDHGGGTACPVAAAKPAISMAHGPAFACEAADLRAACNDPVHPICDPPPIEGRPPQASQACGQIWRRTYLAKDANPELWPQLSPAAEVTQRKTWRKDAQELSRKQTVHEFCRLANLLDRSYSTNTERGRERLYRAWVADRAGADTACGLPTNYIDVTSKAGLAKVQGSRISAADLNGDNYPDLIVRDASDRETDLTVAGNQHAWLLLNDKKGGFVDATASSGLFAGRVTGSGAKNLRASQVIALADIDNDGALDVFAGSPPYTPKGLSGTERPELMRNNGQGVFTRLATYPLPATVYPGGATFVDTNRDSLIDLFVPARDPSTSGATTRGAAWLFQGKGSATAAMTDITSSINSAAGYFQASLACDLNGDGQPELLAPAMDRGPGRLWQSKSGGTYVERGVDSGFAADATTAFQDNLQFQAHCGYVNGKNKVWNAFWSTAQHCQSSGCPADCTTYPCDSFRAATAAEKTACTGAPAYPAANAAQQPIDAAAWVQSRDGVAARLGAHAFGLRCVDFDGDGKMDIIQTATRSSVEGNSADTVQILRNTTTTADVQFTRVSGSTLGLLPIHESGTAWNETDDAVALFDMDNDGRPDMLLDGGGSADGRGRLFKNTTALVGGAQQIKFEGATLFGLDRAAGVVAADFDRDGDLDLVVGHSCYRPGPDEKCDAEPLHLFENRLAPSASANWIELKLVGKVGTALSNKAAIGARVSVTVDGRKVMQEVGGGQGSFGSQSDLVLHFGLGSVGPKAVVSVTWPNSARKTEDLNLAVNAVYQVVENTGATGASVTTLSFPKP